MVIKIGINGFGRIGRLVLRACIARNVEVVMINDAFLNEEYIEYLFKYDSTHGTYPGTVKLFDNKLIVDGYVIELFREKDPSKIPWKNYSVDFVVEATGIFTTLAKANLHLNGGAKYVIITAPSMEVPMYVMGVNNKLFNPSFQVVSNACSTTQCLAPLAHILHENFGIVEGLMLTIHAMSPSQNVVDSPGLGSKREARGALQNIIPASSGAALSIGHILPELNGKLTGMAMKVPISNVSVLDLTVRLQQETTYDEIKNAIQRSCENELNGIMAWTTDDVVSSDFIGDTHSCIFDVKSGIPLNKNFFKLIAWFDNEVAYSNRVVDLILYMASQVTDSANNDAVSSKYR